MTKELLSKEDAVFIGVVITLFVMCTLITLLNWGDVVDVIQTKKVGEIMCESINQSYDYRVISNGIPYIYCKKPTIIKPMAQYYGGIVVGEK